MLEVIWEEKCLQNRVFNSVTFLLLCSIVLACELEDGEACVAGQETLLEIHLVNY